MGYGCAGSFWHFSKRNFGNLSKGRVDLLLFILKLVLLYKFLSSKNSVFQAEERTHLQICLPSTTQRLADFAWMFDQHSIINNANLAHFNYCSNSDKEDRPG